jgi:sterol desaturase/sphingolipid hydroxylase (fatty acid hydroxylase superfamily)
MLGPLEIPIALALSNATEWAFHKYILHGLGKNPKSFWSFHWHEHHRAARSNGHVDPAYREPLLSRWNGQTKEALALVGAALAVAPLLPVAPWFVGTSWYSAINYYRKHRKAHLDPAWAREHLPWHYDHHMAPNQHKNWCVTRPWWDRLMGTRVPYVGTDKEKQDRARKQQRAAAASAVAA